MREDEIPRTMNYPKRLVIIEDNIAVKDGFALLIDSISHYEVIDTYVSCEDALEQLAEDRPDIILLDLNLPGMNGIAGIAHIKKILPTVDIIIITIYENSEWVFEALCAGAVGYITKNTGHAELLRAIDNVVEGGAPMSTRIARMVVKSFQKNRDSPLTARETEVLGQLAQGKSYNRIGEDLFISKETVKTHIKHIYDKLQVNNREEALAKASERRLI